MVYRGHVKNGVVVLDEPCALADGVQVQVTIVQPPAADADEPSMPSLYERLQPIIGAVEGLPPDLSVNHDHYLYGTPKRE